jgi:anthraniloyl-CoA monooxygenase
MLSRGALGLFDALDLAPLLMRSVTIDEALDRYTILANARATKASAASDLLQEWTENLHRRAALSPHRFAFATLTRSLRVNYRDVQRADPVFVTALDRDVAGESAVNTAPPPMFTPYSLRGLTLANRIGVSPMCMYQAENGLPGDFHLVHLGSRAMGGAGLVIAEMTAVSPEGRITTGCTGLYDDEQVGAWRRIVDYVHRFSPTKIGMQLGHAGRRASAARPWEGGTLVPTAKPWETIGPSPLSYADTLPLPREMTGADIRRVVDAFGKAAERTLKAGFDLLELHMAHGYLISSFLSPLANKRHDEFGGDLRGRARFAIEVLRAVRSVWPKPLSVRISAVDWVDGGTRIEDAIELAAMMKEAGADILAVSTGSIVSQNRRPSTGRIFQTPYSDQIRNEVGIPTMTVGRLRSHGDINAIIAAGRADLCLVARGHLYDPYFTLHAAQAQRYAGVEWHESYLLGKESSLHAEP